MKKELIVTSAIAAVVLIFGSAVHAFTGAKYAKEARITIEEARKAALKAFHGKIISEELEKESGGSGLRYSFDIRKGHITREVGVDAKTGRILENSIEGPHPD